MPVMREISAAYGVGFRTFVLPEGWGEPAETPTKITKVLQGAGVNPLERKTRPQKVIRTRYVYS